MQGSFGNRHRSIAKSGFTIVELLVVIVIIAILTGLSVATYHGIQNRAKDTLLLTVAKGVEKKVNIKKAIDGKASPSANLTSVQAVRDHYDLESLGDSVVIMSYNAYGGCINNQSDTCNWSDPLMSRDDVIFMYIYPTGSAGSCTSHGGVRIRYYTHTGEEHISSIPDGPSQDVGSICSGGL